MKTLKQWLTGGLDKELADLKIAKDNATKEREDAERAHSKTIIGWFNDPALTAITDVAKAVQDDNKQE